MRRSARRQWAQASLGIEGFSSSGDVGHQRRPEIPVFGPGLLIGLEKAGALLGVGISAESIEDLRSRELFVIDVDDDSPGMARVELAPCIDSVFGEGFRQRLLVHGQ